MATWGNTTVTNQHLLPYVDSASAPEEIKQALQTLPFERNVFKVGPASTTKSVKKGVNRQAD